MVNEIIFKTWITPENKKITLSVDDQQVINAKFYSIDGTLEETIRTFKMTDEMILKTWITPEDKKVTLVVDNQQVISAKFYSIDGTLEKKIPFEDINNIPEKIAQNILLLFLFVQNTYIRLNRRSDDSIGLYINQRLQGGGWLDFITSVTLGAVGVGLMFTGPVGAFVGSGLINAAINGGIQATKSEKNFNQDYWKETGIGLATGLITGGAAQYASALSTTSKAVKVVQGAISLGNNINAVSTPSAVIITKALVNGGGGAAAQITSSLLRKEDPDASKILLSTVLSGAVGTVFNSTDTGKTVTEVLESTQIRPESFIGKVATKIGPKASQKIGQAATKIGKAATKVGIKITDQKTGLEELGKTGANIGVNYAARKMKSKKDKKIETDLKSERDSEKKEKETFQAEAAGLRQQNTESAQNLAQQTEQNRQLREENRRLREERAQQIRNQGRENPQQNPEPAPQGNQQPPEEQRPNRYQHFQPQPADNAETQGLRQRPVNTQPTNDEDALPERLKK